MNTFRVKYRDSWGRTKTVEVVWEEDHITGGLLRHIQEEVLRDLGVKDKEVGVVEIVLLRVGIADVLEKLYRKVEKSLYAV